MLVRLDYFHLHPSLSKHFPSKGKDNTCIVASGGFLFLILLYNLSKPLFVIVYFKQMSPANLPGETRNASCPEDFVFHREKFGIAQPHHSQEIKGFSIPIAS